MLPEELSFETSNEKEQLLEKLLPQRKADAGQVAELSAAWRKQAQQVHYSETRQAGRTVNPVKPPKPTFGKHSRIRKKIFYQKPVEKKRANDNPLQIMPVAAQLDTTRGGGQHLRKSLSATVTKNLHQVNNIQFFYKFTPFIPSLQPLRRLVGVYARKGKGNAGLRLAERTYAKFKQVAPATNEILPLGHLLLLKRVDAVKSPFTLRSFKIAANKVKVPYLSSYSRSFTAVFALLRELSQSKESLYRKQLMQKQNESRISKGLGKADYAAVLLSSSAEDVLAKKREEAMVEANLNKSNLRYKRN